MLYRSALDLASWTSTLTKRFRKNNVAQAATAVVGTGYLQDTTSGTFKRQRPQGSKEMF
jgi:hypothetical protein